MEKPCGDKYLQERGIKCKGKVKSHVDLKSKLQRAKMDKRAQKDNPSGAGGSTLGETAAPFFNFSHFRRNKVIPIIYAVTTKKAIRSGS